MIAIMKQIKHEPSKKTLENCKPHEIIVKRLKQDFRENENGRLELVTKESKVNITRMVNETKKLIKSETAAEKLAEIQKVFSK